MALTMIRKSPSKTFIPFESTLLAKISTEAPPTPKLNPTILFQDKRSFKIHAAITVMMMGVVSIKRDA